MAKINKYWGLVAVGAVAAAAAGAIAALAFRKDPLDDFDDFDEDFEDETEEETSRTEEKKETSEAFEAWDEAEEAVEKAVEETAETADAEQAVEEAIKEEEAADKKELVAREAFVIPRSVCSAVAGSFPSARSLSFSSSNSRISMSAPGKYWLSPASSIRTFLSIWRTIISICLSLISTPCRRYTRCTSRIM